MTGTAEMLDDLHRDEPLTYSEWLDRIRSCPLKETKVNRLIKNDVVLLTVNMERAHQLDLTEHMITVEEN